MLRQTLEKFAYLARPSMADPPFAVAPPIVTVIDLPMPPSVNRIWRTGSATAKGKVYLSPTYRKWMDQADMAIMCAGGMRGRKIIYGHFRAVIELRRPAVTSDIDNRIKAVLDYAESRGFVTNDKHCDEVTARWSTEVKECRLTLTELFHEKHGVA